MNCLSLFVIIGAENVLQVQASVKYTKTPQTKHQSLTRNNQKHHKYVFIIVKIQTPQKPIMSLLFLLEWTSMFVVDMFLSPATVAVLKKIIANSGGKIIVKIKKIIVKIRKKILMKISKIILKFWKL